MTFQTAPFNITGPSYQSRSKPLSSQLTKNWYPQVAEQGSTKFVLMPFPGLKVFSVDSVEGIDRGLWRMKENLYQVKGTKLYLVDSSGVYYVKGDIPGIERCIMADDGVNLFIVSDLKVWHFNNDDDSLTRITDPNIDGAISVDFINNQFIYTKPDFSTVSNVGDGSSANGLNLIGAETKPDALVRDFVFEQTIWRFGTRTTEGWYNSGVGSPPIDRLDGQIFDVGLSALHSVAETDEAFYWLGDDHAIYRATAGAKQRISTDAISNAIKGFSDSDIANAYGYTFTIQGQNFYAITFKDTGKTLCVNEGLGLDGWFDLSSGIVGGRYQASSMINCYGENIVADESNGKLYTLDLETYTNNGETLQRTRVTTSVNGDSVGARGKRVQMSRLELIMETGIGLIEGQGDNPRIMIEASYDGGRTWSAGTWARVGRLGEFVLKVEWFSLLSFYDMMVRISTTDPVNYSVYSASIDLRLAGK